MPEALRLRPFGVATMIVGVLATLASWVILRDVATRLPVQGVRQIEPAADSVGLTSAFAPGPRLGDLRGLELDRPFETFVAASPHQTAPRPRTIQPSPSPEVTIITRPQPQPLPRIVFPQDRFPQHPRSRDRSRFPRR